MSWYHDLCQFCVVLLGPSVSKRRWRGIFFPFKQPCAFIPAAAIPQLVSLAVTQQRLCRQPAQPAWKNPKADCCVNISHQSNIKCSVIFIHGIVWVILCHCYQAIWQVRGEAGLGRLFRLVGTTGSREWNRLHCRLRWALELFPHLGKPGFRL